MDNKTNEIENCYKPPRRKWWFFGPKEYCPICKEHLQVIERKQIWPSGRRYITFYICDCGYKYKTQRWKSKWEDEGNV